MEDQLAAPKPLPNPVTQKAHRREVLRQITLPISAGVLLLAALITWLVLAGVGDAEVWGQISTIFLLLLVMLLALIPLAAIVAVIFASTQLLSILPPAASQAQQAIEQIEQQIKAGADISLAPMVQVKSFLAMVEALFGRQNHK